MDMDKDRNLPNLPLLFNQLGHFLYALRELNERRKKLTAEEFSKAFGELAKSHSDSELDAALNAYDTIVNTIYNAAARGCPSGSPIVKG